MRYDSIARTEDEPIDAAPPTLHHQWRWVAGCAALFVVVLGASVVAGVMANNNGQSRCAADECTLTADMQGLLDAHNTARAQHGAGALTWDQGLADDASAWVVKCVYQQEAKAGQGENLYTCPDVGITPTIAIGEATPAWLVEAGSYNLSNPGFSDTTGEYTQMIWKATTNIGCAAAYCRPLQGETGVAVFLDCRYTPAGNVMGNFPANVS